MEKSCKNKQENNYDKCLDMKEYQKKSCKWELNNPNLKDPHNHIHNNVKKIYNNVLEYIGNTPMIKLNRLAKLEGIECNLLAKCEFFNPGGSTKDRIAYRMYQENILNKKIKDNNTTLIEATSGNTGIGLALVGAVTGNPVYITLPEKMSQEKVDTLNALGAKIIRTPTEEPCDSVNSHIGVAIRLNKEIENSCIPDQYTNIGNGLAHYDGTGQEIWDQTEGKVDIVVIGAGTGGTITGVSKKLKEKNPKIQIWGVDPIGSDLALPEALNEEGKGTSYKVEGIGYDFIPRNCLNTIVDKWFKSNDKDSFTYSRKLISEEGLLVGGSSGSVFSSVVSALKSLPKDKTVVFVFVDSIRNYMTKHINDDWMIESKFYDQNVIDKDLKAFGGEEVIQLVANKFYKIEQDNNNNHVNDLSTVGEVLELMKNKNINCLPVFNNEKNKKIVIGLITKKSLISHLVNLTLKKEDKIKKAIIKEFKKLSINDPIKFLSKAFKRHDFVLITEDEKENVYRIATPENILDIFENDNLNANLK